jgi:hypothetical protein
MLFIEVPARKRNGDGDGAAQSGSTPLGLEMMLRKRGLNMGFACSGPLIR